VIMQLVHIQLRTSAWCNTHEVVVGAADGLLGARVAGNADDADGAACESRTQVKAIEDAKNTADSSGVLLPTNTFRNHPQEDEKK